MGDVVHDVDARDVLLLEEIDSLAFLLGEDRDKHVCPGHLLAARGLDVEHGSLEDALEAERRLCLAFLVAGGYQRSGGVDELLEVGAQLVHVAPDGAEHLDSRRVVQQRQKQMLDRHELMALTACVLERRVEGNF